MLNESQSKQLEQTAKSLSDAVFEAEVNRLIASRCDGAAGFSDYPLCTIMNIALENIAGNCYVDKKAYLKKF